MKSHRLKSIVVAAAIVLVVVLGVAGFLLYRGILSFSRGEKELKTARSELDRLYARNPFPSQEDVEQEETNLAVLRGSFDGFLQALSRDQVEQEDRTPYEFMDMFWNTRKTLIARAKAHNIAVPDDCMFGFAAYRQGAPPVSNDVPRLVQQLGIITNLCVALYDAGITEFDGISRDYFDAASLASPEAATAASGRRGERNAPAAASAGSPPAAASAVGVLGPQDLYAKLHFELEFKATPAVLLRVLNHMAASRMFVDVTGLQMASAESGALSAATAGAPVRSPTEKGAAEASTLAKDDRIVSGREKPAAVKLAVDVYRFRKGIEQ